MCNLLVVCLVLFSYEVFLLSYVFLVNIVLNTAVSVLVFINYLLHSVLWRCWLGGRKGIRPGKTEWWGAGMIICLERGADLHMAQLMPLPLTVSCFSKIQIGCTFLVLADLGSPGKRAVKRVLCVCVTCCTQACWCAFTSVLAAWRCHNLMLLIACIMYCNCRRYCSLQFLSLLLLRLVVSRFSR